MSGGPARLALALALVACGGHPATPRPDDPPAPTSAGLAAPDPPTGPNAHSPENMSDTTCSYATDGLGDLEWIPRDVRLAAVLDLADPGVDAAAAELARAVATTPGLPIVAGLGLAQLDLQLRILRGQLAAAGLAPRELVLLHGPDGAVVWVLRARCDLGALQAALARAWGVRSRATAAGPIAEPPPGGGFPHDVVFLADDRLALAPAGAGGRLRRWLEGQVPTPELAPVRRVETPAETLAGLTPAPIRVVLAGRGLLAGDAAESPRTLRAWPDRVVVGGPDPAPRD